ncbi:hypothetical protein BGW38_009751 [Lunasporangiospora selenospora]|uniref:PX domain-containing protein n=1 Tax=Lunasporangiospora selenospora TaxID=979761 RepID=A0A9P6FZ40_9FUNG|nr:hypothetical protein BGW38_009751 [Lunasporangiospora selenospora]
MVAPASSIVSDSTSPTLASNTLGHRISVSSSLSAPLPEKLSTVELTDIMVKTNVDPHLDTTTTTTIVHLPFEVASNCPAPRVISWMKSSKSRSQHQHQHHHHHHHQGRSSSLGISKIFPFSSKRHRAGTDGDNASVARKGNSAATIFSIQVTVVGRVHAENIVKADDDINDYLVQDLAPTRTIPGQLDRSETTSYVIHRTFEDFQHLSEMVLRLDHSLRQYQRHDRGTDGSTAQGPELDTLHVHHPHPGLYQTFLKQFSNAKANQRAFDASSTTHGFEKEGAFERVLEMNQYLENIWYWLMPSRSTTSSVDGQGLPHHPSLSLEQLEIMQWLKPHVLHKPQSSGVRRGSRTHTHADGRQMRESSTESTPQYQGLNPMPKATRSQTKLSKEERKQSMLAETASSSLASRTVDRHPTTTTIATITPTSSDITVDTSEANPSTSTIKQFDVAESSSCSSCSSSSSSSLSLSIPSSSSPEWHTRSGEITSNMGSSVATKHLTGPTPPLSPKQGLNMFLEENMESDDHFGAHDRRSRVLRAGDDDAEKIKRRLSFSQVLRALKTTSSSPALKSLHHGNSKRSSFDHDLGAKSSSSSSIHSGQTSPLMEEIYIWNTITTKNVSKGPGPVGTTVMAR